MSGKFPQSLNTTGKICGSCEVFSRIRHGFCPIAEVEVGRDRPACASFVEGSVLDNWQSKQIQNDSGSREKSNIIGGVHLHVYEAPKNCNGPNPNYCPVYCENYWNCTLVLEEAKKKNAPKR